MHRAILVYLFLNCAELCGAKLFCAELCRAVSTLTAFIRSFLNGPSPAAFCCTESATFPFCPLPIPAINIIHIL